MEEFSLKSSSSGRDEVSLKISNLDVNEKLPPIKSAN